MPKPSTHPPLYDEVLQIHLSKLIESDYLKPGQISAGTINWSSNGQTTASVSFQANTQKGRPYIELNYKYRDETRRYRIYLTSIPSNLDRGEVWYFICPATNKRCRKLYLIGGYFLHRDAFTGCMYRTQTQSKEQMQINRVLGAYLKADKLQGKIYKKHFKKTYAGKPTKRYLQLLSQLQRAEHTLKYEMARVLPQGEMGLYLTEQSG